MPVLCVDATLFREETMKAIRIHNYGDSRVLQLEEAPTVTIQPGQLLVRIRDAGVNPIDWKIPQNNHSLR